MRLWPKIKDKYGEESIFKTLAVLGYQYGRLQQMIVYSDKFPEYGKQYRAEAKVYLANLIIQAELMCERLGWQFEEMRELGHMKFLRSDEPERKGGEVDGRSRDDRGDG